MRHVRHRPAHRLVDLGLARRIGEMIDATDHMCDPHIVIIDDDGEIISRIAVGSEDDEIVQVLVLEDDTAHDAILDHGLAVLWRLEADRRLHALRGLGRIAIAPGAVIAHGALFHFGLFPHLPQLFGRAVAAIGEPAGEQDLGDLAMARGAPILRHGLAVPVESEPR